MHMVQRLLNNASKQRISDTGEQLPPIFWGGRWQKTRAMIVYISPQSFRKQACLIDGLAPFVHQIPQTKDSGLSALKLERGPQ